MSDSHPATSGAVLGTRRVCQIAVVVRDIEQSARAYAEFFGLPVPPIITTEPGLKVNQTYRGQPSDARCKLAFFQLDNTEIELTQPLGGPSSWQDILDEKGECIHHIAFQVTGTAEKTRLLQARGISLLHQGGDPKTGQFSYFDTREQLGLIVETLEGYR
ncbi:MAG TPA: VOC family protein [Lacunisphaera sp.]|nr:VOC family protein [Lacunisphaera sp.]